MPAHFSQLWTFRHEIDRLPYLLTGVVLMLIKFGVDWTIATQGFGLSWSPYSYLIWPDYDVLHVYELTLADRGISLILLMASLPFIWIGVMLTVQRLRSAQLPVAMVVLFFVPVINLCLFLVLILVPARPPLAQAALPQTEWQQLRRLRDQHRRMTRDEQWAQAGAALAVSVPLAVGLVVLGANYLESYGFGLFVGAPFFLGLFSVLLFGLSRPQPLGHCVLLAVSATTLAGLTMLLVAIEGFICLAMASPIAFFLSCLGALIGYTIQARPWVNEQSPLYCLALLVLLPGFMVAENRYQPEAELRAVRTTVIVDAPPERVWQHVIAFAPLPEPDDWLFCSGIAYPQRAEIHGSGVGAIRHCVFSTGAFVEPIDVWDPPNRLGFQVTEQPPPMVEWSPFDIHPPHLDHFLVSRRGQFQLTALPDGRTQLEGTTWYTNKMWPAVYWNVWSDYIIQRIHRRVLAHIGGLAARQQPIEDRPDQ